MLGGDAAMELASRDARRLQAGREGVYSCRGCQTSESRSRTERAAIGSLKPNKEKLEPVASYKVAEGGTYAYPVISGKKIYIKDSDSVALWMIP